MTERTRVTVNGRTFEVVVLAHDLNSVRYEINGREYEARVEESLPSTEAAAQTPMRHLASGARRTLSKGNNENQIRAPMPGLVKAILVQEGDSFDVGDVLLRVEAMKMENNIFAQTEGRVTRIHVRSGQEIGDQELLVEFTSRKKDSRR